MSKKTANQFACSRLILPEHREQLHRHHRAAREREGYRLLRLDQQQWESFEVLVNQSLEQGSMVMLTVSGRSGGHCVTGRVIRVDPLEKRITLAVPEGVQSISLPEVINMEAAFDL